jgi:outer membrane protein assembly factor BamB
VQRFTSAVSVAGTLLAGVTAGAQERVMRLQELDPRASTRWTVSLPVVGRENPHTLVEGGIAVLEDGGRTLRVYGFDGGVRQEVRSAVPSAGIAGSARGDRVLVWSYRGEDEALHRVHDAAGRELWSATLGSALAFSASGRFLLPTWDALDSSVRASAYRAEDGAPAWTGPAGPHYWQLASAENDTLAYYQPGQLELVDLPSGRARWQRRVPADADSDFGRLRMSRDGAAIVVQSHQVASGTRRILTTAFDASGAELWQKQAEVVPGATNGGVLKAISSDGRLVALDDVDAFSILRVSDGTEVARLPRRSPWRILAFTEDMLAFDLGGRTRVLRLREGAITGDYTVEEPLEFFYRIEAEAGGRYRSVAKKRATGRLELSEVDFRLDRAAVR